LGCAEDEYGDGEPKYAKLRPMRVEMYEMNWNDDAGKIYHEAIRRGVIHHVSTAGRNPFQFILYIATDSGENTSLEMILAVLINIIKNKWLMKGFSVNVVGLWLLAIGGC